MQIGKIVGVHGLGGNVKVQRFSESTVIFEPGSRILVRADAGGETVYEIDWARPHARNLLISFRGVDDRLSAESLVGSALFFEKAMLPEPEIGEYYWDDLIGMCVYTNDGAYLGKIGSIIETGSNDVYVVSDPDQDPLNETLIPALESVVLEIDVNTMVMRVELPEGL